MAIFNSYVNLLEGKQNWVNFGILSEEATLDAEDMRMYPWNLADGRSLNPPCFRITANYLWIHQKDKLRHVGMHVHICYLGIWYDVFVCHCMSKMGSKH